MDMIDRYVHDVGNRLPRRGGRERVSRLPGPAASAWSYRATRRAMSSLTEACVRVASASRRFHVATGSRTLRTAVGRPNGRRK